MNPLNFLSAPVKFELVETISQLNENDVVLVLNPITEAKTSNWLKCSFRRITVIRAIRDGAYDHKHFNRLVSENGDHQTILKALNEKVILEAEAYGSDCIIDENHITYKLTGIKNDTEAHKSNSYHIQHNHQSTL